MKRVTRDVFFLIFSIQLKNKQYLCMFFVLFLVSHTHAWVGMRRPLAEK